VLSLTITLPAPQHCRCCGPTSQTRKAFTLMKAGPVQRGRMQLSHGNVHKKCVLHACMFGHTAVRLEQAKKTNANHLVDLLGFIALKSSTTVRQPSARHSRHAMLHGSVVEAGCGTESAPRTIHHIVLIISLTCHEKMCTTFEYVCPMQYILPLATAFLCSPRTRQCPSPCRQGERWRAR
jgi:hypothetical protein